MANESEYAQKPPLYRALLREIEKSGYQIPQEIYESQGLIVSGLRSAVVLQNQPMTVLSADNDRLSIRSATLRDAAALDSQNPKRQRFDKNTAGVIDIDAKLVLLTPQQQNALNGQNRQFIIGAPGTGKTIILQAKASQLLEEGKKVLIYSSHFFVGQYKRLFRRHANCQILETHPGGYYSSLELTHKMEERMRDYKTLREAMDNISEWVPKNGLTSMQNDLKGFDCMLFDDAFDILTHVPGWRIEHYYQLISLMATAINIEFQSKVVWIAGDPYLDLTDAELFKRGLNQLIRGEQGDYFSTTILDRVMRSSENVFQATYTPEVIQDLVIMPEIGHKIHGFSAFVHFSDLSVDDARLEIWKQTDGAVKKFKEEGFEYGHMAVITGGGESGDLELYLRQKFRENGIPAGYYEASASATQLTLARWNNVSSHEWPVVIYAALFEDHEERTSGAYYRYRACSRATMKLFEIIADRKTY